MAGDPRGGAGRARRSGPPPAVHPPGRAATQVRASQQAASPAGAARGRAARGIRALRGDPTRVGRPGRAGPGTAERPAVLRVRLLPHGRGPSGGVAVAPDGGLRALLLPGRTGLVVGGRPRGGPPLRSGPPRALRASRRRRGEGAGGGRRRGLRRREERPRRHRAARENGLPLPELLLPSGRSGGRSGRRQPAGRRLGPGHARPDADAFPGRGDRPAAGPSRRRLRVGPGGTSVVGRLRGPEGTRVPSGSGPVIVAGADRGPGRGRFRDRPGAERADAGGRTRLVVA